MIRQKPKSDFAPKPPQHVFQAWFWGDQCCSRCHRRVSEIDARNLECVSDQQVKDAEAASRAFAAVRKR